MQIVQSRSRQKQWWMKTPWTSWSESWKRRMSAWRHSYLVALHHLWVPPWIRKVHKLPWLVVIENYSGVLCCVQMLGNKETHFWTFWFWDSGSCLWYLCTFTSFVAISCSLRSLFAIAEKKLREKIENEVKERLLANQYQLSEANTDFEDQVCSTSGNTGRKRIEEI